MAGVGDFLGIFYFFFKDGCGWVGRIVVTLCAFVCVCVFMEKLGLRP